MTTKNKILSMIQRLNEDITYDDVIHKLEFMRHVEQGLQEADQGLGIDHDDFMAQLEAEDAANQASLDAKGNKRLARGKGLHRANGTGKRPKIRAKDQGGRKKP